MSYFSRLTDIVTCNLSALLAEAPDPAVALAEIVTEMREGLAGARRSVATAAASAERLVGEIDEHRHQAIQWEEKARAQLKSGEDEAARDSLLRKREVHDLIAGLEQQQRAAQATKDHLSTMQRALEARLAEALRRQEESGIIAPSLVGDSPEFTRPSATERSRQQQVESELDALKRELGLP